jgi:hypothetical protein
VDVRTGRARKFFGGAAALVMSDVKGHSFLFPSSSRETFACTVSQTPNSLTFYSQTIGSKQPSTRPWAWKTLRNSSLRAKRRKTRRSATEVGVATDIIAPSIVTVPRAITAMRTIETTDIEISDRAIIERRQKSAHDGSDAKEMATTSDRAEGAKTALAMTRTA